MGTGQTDKHQKRQRDKQTKRQTNKETNIQREKQTNRISRQTKRQPYQLKKNFQRYHQQQDVVLINPLCAEANFLRIGENFKRYLHLTQYIWDI